MEEIHLNNRQKKPFSHSEKEQNLNLYNKLLSENINS
jgi:hypothetical protein